MAITITELDKIPVVELTQATVDGTGVFDVLMQANKVHLEQEFQQSRIRGPEYATVYLGVIEATMRSSMEFLTQRYKLVFEARLLDAQVAIAEAQLAQAAIELQIAQMQLQKIPAEIAVLTAQATKIDQETSNLIAEAEIIPKQGEKLDAELLLIPKQGLKIEADTDLTKQQITNLVAQELLIPKQGVKLDADTAMVTQQTANGVIEGTVLTAQKCKLDAEYDLLLGQKLKVVAETAVLNLKANTERAQTASDGVDPDSVIGRQKLLYVAQTEGFKRDAEQKAAKIMIDTWNVRRTTDEGTEANAANNLQDPTIGRAVNAMLTGVNA